MENEIREAWKKANELFGMLRKLQGSMPEYSPERERTGELALTIENWCLMVEDRKLLNPNESRS